MSEPQAITTILGPDSRLTGELILAGDAVLHGQFTGLLRVGGLLEVGESAWVQGEIAAGAVRIAGRVQADVVAEHGVELLSGAVLEGRLFTARLSVAAGAVLDGAALVGEHARAAAAETLPHLLAEPAPEPTPAGPARRRSPAEPAGPRPARVPGGNGHHSGVST